jgi:hypothetical protein
MQEMMTRLVATGQKWLVQWMTAICRADADQQMTDLLH